MKQEVKTLINYRLERAHEALDEALILLERGHANTLLIVFIMPAFMRFLPYCLPKNFPLLSTVVYGHYFFRTL